jgi:diguanylate cyclase (GGDEF)-like protein
MSHSVTKRRIVMLARYVAREREILAVSQQREFATRVGTALDMAETEQDALSTTESVLETLAPEMPVELLLADNSYAHLERMAASPPDGEPPGCPVGSPQGCISARRAQTLVFGDSRDFDACPKLRQRTSRGPLAAVCVPVSIVGRTVGVLHGAQPVDEQIDGEVVAGLQVVADQIGIRLGMLRIVSDSQLQATTDGLTGLINRRTLENEVRRLHQQNRPFALAMVDLDSFKALNDRHGHETGDRALRLFAEILRSSIRESDIACRYGGEEFMIALPASNVEEARLTLERIREHLARALVGTTLPGFTCSFGLAAPDGTTGFEQLTRRADALMYQAKAAGGDCIVVDGDADLPAAPEAEAATLTAVRAPAVHSS